MGKDGHKPVERSAAELDHERKSRIVNFLRNQVDKPYQTNADPRSSSAFDCSSLVYQAYQEIGLNLQRTAIAQAAKDGRPVEQHEEYVVGDLLFFSGEEGRYSKKFPQGFGIGHVGTYIGDGRVIHTTSWFDDEGIERGGVIEETLEEALKRRADLVGKPDDLVLVIRVFQGNTYYFEGKALPMPDLPERVE